MSAHAPRRRFASPFVVTLAAAGSAACTNPPRPAAPQVTPDPGVPTEPTPGGEPVGNREPAKFERHWTISKLKDQAECRAQLHPNCPTPDPNKPMPTCNPPAPSAYVCPPYLADGDYIRIVLRVGATDCFVEPPPCPPDAKCNIPPPRKVVCPGL